MRHLKLAIISIILIFLFFTGISLFIPSQVNISRAINLPAKDQSFLELIKDTSRWNQWYPGYDTLRSKGTKVLITNFNDTLITAEFSNDRAKKSITSSWQIIPYSQSDSVTLQWYLHFKLRWYPWEKFGSLLYEKSYGQHMEKALNNLKQLVSKN